MPPEVLPGDDPASSVEILWWRDVDGAEAMAVADDVLYTVGFSAAAFDLRTGDSVWTGASDAMTAFESSGGVEIEVAPDELIVWAPHEFTARLDRSTGQVLDVSQGAGEAPPGFRSSALTPAAGLSLEYGDWTELVVKDRDGGVAWRVRGGGPPEFDAQGPFEVDELILIQTMTPELVVLRHTGR